MVFCLFSCCHHGLLLVNEKLLRTVAEPSSGATHLVHSGGSRHRPTSVHGCRGSCSSGVVCLGSHGSWTASRVSLPAPELCCLLSPSHPAWERLRVLSLDMPLILYISFSRVHRLCETHPLVTVSLKEVDCHFVCCIY